MLQVEKILCSKTHEYIFENDNKIFTVGLTDYAVEQLGDIVFVELPEVGAVFSKGDIFSTVESVKAASELYMPVSGTVTEINEAIVDNPELLNTSPYEEGWIVKIESCADQLEFSDLLEYSDYKEELN